MRLYVVAIGAELDVVVEAILNALFQLSFLSFDSCLHVINEM